MNEQGFIIKEGVLQKYLGHSETVVIPEGVTDIGENAFYECHSLKSVEIPKSVMYLGVFAFPFDTKDIRI